MLTTLHRFDYTYGAAAHSPLALGTDGNLYGVASGGGLNGYGTIFKMTPAGQFTTLWRFNGKNGAGPNGDLVLGTDGNFYGTTAAGGAVSGIGTVFRITPQGRLTTLHTFMEYGFNNPGGQSPAAGLLLAPDGSFYGTTYSLPADQGHLGFGTVFHITPSGDFKTLHTFTAGEGEYPSCVPVFGPDGALYGTTEKGGRNNVGTVFRLTTDGTFATLHEFTGDDGGFAFAGLTVGPDGAFYGVTYAGGIGYTSGYFDGAGVAYRVTAAGAFTVLHKFSQDGHGAGPFAALTLGADGCFYSTTVGTVFMMTPAGQVTTLYKFHTNFDGYGANGGVIFGPDGALYGTTINGGRKGYGTLYKLILPQ